MTVPLNIAHRGGARLWPENTRFAFESAARAGYDGAEFDVQLSRDDKLVVFHDLRLKPELCRDPSGRWIGRHNSLPIRALSLAELRVLDVGRPKPGTLYARRHPRLVARDGERMPTLGEIVAAVRDVPRFRLFIELKTSADRRVPSASPQALAEAVVQDLRAADFFDRAVLIGFDWAGLIHAKRIEARAECWFSTRRPARIAPHAILDAGGVGWFCPLRRASASTVRQAQALGLRLGIWTVDRPRDLQRLISLGVDAICTDRPDRLRQMMSES